MPTEADPTTGATGANPAIPADAVSAAMASLAASAPPADVVRQSPEYLALQEQNRALARQAGQSRSEAERYRLQVEADHQAAEAQRAAALQQQLQSTLGPNAQAFAEIAQLMQTDPVAAAARFQQVTSAQSHAAPQAPAANPAPAQEPVVPPTQQPVPSMSGTPGVSASVPLGAPPQRSLEEEGAAHIAMFEQTVASNRDMQARTRVRGKERAEAVGNYLRGALMRDHGVKLDALTFKNDR